MRVIEMIRLWAARLLIAMGIGSVVFVGLSFTDLPFHALLALSMPDRSATTNQDVVVLMSGAGSISGDGLLRSYHAALALERFPNAQLVVAMPLDSGSTKEPLDMLEGFFSDSALTHMSIMFETKGINTHQQAANITNIITDHNLRLLIITAPHHVYRSIKAFEREGFANVSAMAAFEKPIREDLLTDGKGSGVQQVSIRYNTWSYMHHELDVLREFCAIGYYWLMGWV